MTRSQNASRKAPRSQHLYTHLKEDYPLQGTPLDVPLPTALALSPQKRSRYIRDVLTALGREITKDTMALKQKVPFKKEMRDLRKLLHAPADQYLYTDDTTFKRNVLGKGSPGSTHTYWSRTQMWKMKTNQGDLAEMISHKHPALVGKLDKLFDATNNSKKNFRHIKLTAVQNALIFLQLDKSSGTAFPPFHAKYFADKFLPQEGEGLVVDPCAGWGGRLLGTLSVRRAGHVRYIGIDPEKRNKPAYEGLLRRLNGYLKKELTGTRSGHMYYQAFEDWIKTPAAKKLYGKADLVITSPPYANAENYNPANAKQSANRYGNYERWREGFYRKLIRGAFALLKPGGTLVLNIADVASANRLERDARILAHEAGFKGAGFYKLAMSVTPGTRKSIRHTAMVNGVPWKSEPVFLFSKPLTEGSPQPQVAPVLRATTPLPKALSRRKTKGEGYLYRGEKRSVPIVRDKAGNLGISQFAIFALTPVEKHDGVYFKRDDLYQPLKDFAITGGKVRQCLALVESHLNDIRKTYNSTIATVSSVHSPQSVIVARVAKELGLKCIIGIGNKVNMNHAALQMCKEYGAEIVTLPTAVNYDGVLTSKLQSLAAKRKMYIIKFGLRAESDPGAIIEMNARQAQNLPKKITKLIIPVGSAISASGILKGIQTYLPKLIAKNAVTLIQPFGNDRTTTIEEITGLEQGKGFRYYKGHYNYANPLRVTIGNDFELDHIYESKAYDCFVTHKRDLGITKHDVVCFWVIGNANALRGR